MLILHTKVLHKQPACEAEERALSLQSTRLRSHLAAGCSETALCVNGSYLLGDAELFIYSTAHVELESPEC